MLRYVMSLERTTRPHTPGQMWHNRPDEVRASLGLAPLPLIVSYKPEKSVCVAGRVGDGRRAGGAPDQHNRSAAWDGQRRYDRIRPVQEGPRAGAARTGKCVRARARVCDSATPSWRNTLLPGLVSVYMTVRCICERPQGAGVARTVAAVKADLYLCAMEMPRHKVIGANHLW